MIKLISLNIQQDMHNATAVPFLIKENPDIVCLQEILENDIEMYGKALGMKSCFAPNCFIESFISSDGKERKFGIAVFSKNDFSSNFEYIVGSKDNIPLFEFKNSLTEPNITNVALLWIDTKDKEGNAYRFATTHFTWTPEGEATSYQLEHTKKLVSILENNLKSFILTGDLNAPRGREAFDMLANKYKDNIPKEYDNSLDPILHRVKNLRHMVDGLFSTGEYLISNVSLVEGVSDHKAVVAHIEKVK